MSRTQVEKYKSKSGKVFEYDAKEKLDIDGIDNKCQGIVDAATTGCESIVKKIKDVEIGKETLSVADSSLEPALEEVENYIKSIASEGVQPSVDQIKKEAETAFNKLQAEENERAKADCAAEDARWEAEQAKKNEEN